MSRNEFVARLFLTANGIYLLVFPLSYLPSMLVYNLFSWDVFFWKAILITVVLFIWFLALYQLWFKTDDWAKLMTGFQQSQSPSIERIWAIVGLRIVYMLIGLQMLNITFIIEALKFVIKAPRILFEMYLYRYIDGVFLISFTDYLRIASNIIAVLLSAYLLTGAPNLLRLQLRQFFPKQQ